MKEPLYDLAYHIGYIIGRQNICGYFEGKQKESNNILQVSVYNQNTTLL